MPQKRVVVLTGAGISAESGLKTFRDSDGLWSGYKIEDVCTPGAWERDPQKVLDFYNQRRRDCIAAAPNSAHLALKDLESRYIVDVITQNVDDLHERAGSSDVLHLHGELMRARSSRNPSVSYEWKKEINLGDKCELGSQLRPDIVWFGEPVPLIPKAGNICSEADILIVIGTSLLVYPAAGLIENVAEDAAIYLIDPSPNLSATPARTKVLKEVSTKAVPELVRELMRG